MLVVMQGIKNQQKEIKIVPALPGDVEGMQEVFYKTWLNTYPNKQFDITVDDIEDRFKDRLGEKRLQERRERIVQSPHTTFLAKESDQVVGLCRVQNTDTQNKLQAICVLPEYQGKGIGTRLWEEAQKTFDKSKDTFVAVATYNANAISFYKKLGFEDTGKRFTGEKLRMKSGVTIPEMGMIIRATED